MSGINIADITSKTLLGATFAQAVYSNQGLAPFTPPVGFVSVDVKFSPTATSSLTGFAAEGRCIGHAGVAEREHQKIQFGGGAAQR